MAFGVCDNIYVEWCIMMGWDLWMLYTTAIPSLVRVPLDRIDEMRS